jgi:hypothetical protein
MPREMAAGDIASRVTIGRLLVALALVVLAD